MTEETRGPITQVDENVGAEAPPTAEGERNTGAEAPPAGEPARREPMSPTPKAPPPPPPVPEPKVKIPKGLGPPLWMAPVAALLLIIGLAAFAYGAWSYVSGMSASLRAGQQALLSIEAMEHATAGSITSTEKDAFIQRGNELKRNAISSDDRSKVLRHDAMLWGLVGLFPLVFGFVLMIIYRKKKERARNARVR